MSPSPSDYSSAPAWWVNHLTNVEADVIQQVLQDHGQWALVVEIDFQDGHVAYELEPVSGPAIDVATVCLPALAKALHVDPEKLTCRPSQGNHIRITMAR